MKVVLLTPFYRPDNYGGAVKVYESLCREQEFEAHIICPIASEDFDDSKYYDETKITIHRCAKIQFNYTSNSILKRVKEFSQYRKNTKSDVLNKLRQIKPDIIINGGVRWFSWMNSDFMKIAPVINYIHGEELSIMPIGIFGRWLLKKQNESFSKVDLNLCVSSFTANKVAEISLKSKVTVLTNFVDTESYYPHENKPELKLKHGLNNKFSIVCVCRLIKRKGVDDLLKAVSRLSSDKSIKQDIILNVCGSGSELNDLKALSSKLGISDKVIFHGFTEEDVMLELIQASDIFAMPNKTIDGDLEGFGLVFLEANACGLPAIGGESGGVVDAIEDGVSGYLVNPSSIDDISEKILKFIEDPDLLRDMGLSSFERAVNSFTLNQKRKEFESILLNLLSDN
jgi:phosphatidylinositol alpha-1,6-mannosyltransferase